MHKTPTDINLLVKAIRAKVIKDYLHETRAPGCVCFSCGNATKYLRQEGVEVVGVGAKESLVPGKWFTGTEIARTWPGFLNATSGDLPLHLIYKVADKLRFLLGRWPGGRVKIGSGETYLILRLAYPKAKIIPYRDGTPATEYNGSATLNRLLLAFGVGIAKPKGGK